MADVQRGIRLHTQLLFEEDTPPALPKRKFPHRHPELIAARNRFLIHRFYFKSKLQRKVYQDVLGELEKELYLSRVMIQKILQSKSDDALKLKKEQVSVKQMRDEWPHINWLL